MEKVKEIFRSVTFRHSSITVISTGINGLLGAIFYFLLARFLGSQGFGVFSVLVTSIALLTGLVDLGTDQGIVKFIPKYKNDPTIQNKLMKLALETKFLSGMAIFVIVLLLSRQIADFIFAKHELTLIIPLIGLGVLTQLLFSFATSLSQSLERYMLWGGLFIGTNLIRLLGILGLFYFSTISAFSSGLIYISLPFLGFIFSFLFFDRKFLFAKGELAHISEVFKFNRWVLAFVAISTIGSRLDTYFTVRYLALSSLGVYALAQQVVSILSQLTSAIGAVTSPKFASFDTKEKNLAYTSKASLMTSFTALASSAVLIILAPFVFSFAGKDFSGAFIPFLILLLAMIIFLSTSPIRDSIIYYFGKPEFFFWQGAVHILIVSVASILLIPHYGVLGTSLVVLIGQIFIALTAVWYFFKKSKG